MLRVYRAPKTEPGRTTLQTDAATWNEVIAAVRAQRDQASIDLAQRVTRAVALARGGQVLRVTLPTADAQVVLSVAAR
jgi:hypothetical protein